MDIARLLNHVAESDLSDAELVGGDGLCPSPRAMGPSPPPRPKSRRKRKPSLESMRAQVQAFEAVAAHLPFVLGELEHEVANSPPSDLKTVRRSSDGDTSTQRIREFLRHMLVLSAQHHHELAVRTELLLMLQRHRESTASLRKLTRGLALDDWFWACERWRLVTRECYKPLRTAECYRLVQDTMRAIEAFKLPTRPSTSTKSFFGWRDAQIVVQQKGYVHFRTRKTLPHGAIKSTADGAWGIYQDGAMYKQFQLGDHCELFHQILQRVSDDIVVMQTVEQYPGMRQQIHSVSVVFRVETPRGYLLAVRCTHPRELESAVRGEGLAIGDNFFWIQWDVTRRDASTAECTEFQATFAGHIGADYDGYARWWATELVLALVRAETNMGASLSSLEPEDHAPRTAT